MGVEVVVAAGGLVLGVEVGVAQRAAQVAAEAVGEADRDDVFAGARASRAFEMQPDTLLTDAFSSDICEGLPAGTYSWSAPDGFLVLTALSDPCDARVVVLAAGPWALSS